jgi:hypothetical protein
MNEERHQAYRNLIDALLNCKEGEEWNLLQAHQELLDSDFIEVMAQVAEELEGKGDEKGADFLRNLSDALVSVAVYQGIITQLLNCVSDEEVWQILDTNQDFVDAGLQQTMVEVAEDLRIQGDLEQSNFLMNLVEQLMGVDGNTSDAQLDFLMQVLNLTSNLLMVSTVITFFQDLLEQLKRSQADQNLIKGLEETLKIWNANPALIVEAWEKWIANKQGNLDNTNFMNYTRPAYG